jgi:hypothetical protein
MIIIIKINTILKKMGNKIGKNMISQALMIMGEEMKIIKHLKKILKTIVRNLIFLKLISKIN